MKSLKVLGPGPGGGDSGRPKDQHWSQGLVSACKVDDAQVHVLGHAHVAERPREVGAAPLSGGLAIQKHLERWPNDSFKELERPTSIILRAFLASP